VRVFATAEEFLTAPEREVGPLCLVVDLRLPGLSGLDLQERLRELDRDAALVFISGRGDIESGIQAMKGGAVDFLQKPLSEEELLGAVDRALERAGARHAEHADRASLRARFDTLTPREKEVFGLIASGLLNKQAGAELGTTEKTIKVHRGRVMHKMAAASLAQLVRMADRLGALAG
jgi:FixJ family two-component response regulator